MATPMRSTDFRSIVEPILNEAFDGVYDQRADEWKQVFRETDACDRRRAKSHNKDERGGECFAERKI